MHTPEEYESQADMHFWWHVEHYKSAHIALIAQRDEFVLLAVSPLDDMHHRQSTSLVFAVYANASAARFAASRVDGDLVGVLGDALAVIADPDLRLGDFTVDRCGDIEALPGPIRVLLNLVDGSDYFDAPRRVAPADLSDATMAWLRSPATAPPPRIDNFHPRYFALERGGVRIAVIDCNGKKWFNAVQTVLRLGVTGEAMTEEQAAAAAHLYERVRLPADYVPNGSEFKAERRKSGTAPVSERTREGHRWRVERLGNAEAYPLPDTDAAARKLLKKMDEELKERKQRGTALASHRQLTYASDIARGLGIPLPYDGQQAAEQIVGAFIEKHQADFKAARKPKGSGRR